MSRQLATAVLQIANAGTASQALSDIWGVNPAKVGMDHAVSVSITAPAALTGVATVLVRAQELGAWTAQQSPAGADITVAAGKTVVIPAIAAKDLRINSSLAEGAARDFVVNLQEEIG